jgi:phospholipase C
MLIISPFARGGFISSDTFDHTSVLRFLETRFGAEVPNLSAWRRATVGDMTPAFNFSKPDTYAPVLPTLNAADTTLINGSRLKMTSASN